MKKIVSIPLIILILFTGITVNVASHYCGGTYIASKISLSGELASCGMEHSSDKEPGFNEADHLCEDFTSEYTFNSNYIPSATTIADNASWFQADEPAANIISAYRSQLLKGGAVNRPPGFSVPGFTDPEMICIFRI